MSNQLTAFGEEIEVIPEGIKLKQIAKGMIAKGEKLKTARLVISAGEEIAEYKAMGEIAVICLAGHAHFTTRDEFHQLWTNSLLCLPGRQTHAVQAVEDSVLLVVVVN